MVARAALVAHEEALDWPAEWVVTGMEVADHLPDDWTVEVYLDREPGPDDLQRVAALFAARKDAYGAYESYLGAEHEDPSPRKTAAAKRGTNAGGFDQRAVKIYG